MKSFSPARAAAIFAKEFKHILRDPFTLVMAILLPLAIVLILGNSIEFNISNRMILITRNKALMKFAPNVRVRLWLCHRILNAMLWLVIRVMSR